MTFDRHLQDRLGAALFRLARIERRASVSGESPGVATRLVEDVRRLTSELERTFGDVTELLAECNRLGAVAQAAEACTRRLFEVVPAACLFTDDRGLITEANPEAVRLLNVSQRHLVGRSFHLYLGADRESFLKRLASLREGEAPHVWSAPVRPRERGPLAATLTLAPHPAGGFLIALQPDDKINRSPLMASMRADITRRSRTA
jgi:PAS domain S-box-containing protein